MALPHVATLAFQRELTKINMRLYLASRLCTKNEAMAPFHVATLAVKRKLPKYEIIFSI